MKRYRQIAAIRLDLAWPPGIPRLVLLDPRDGRSGRCNRLRGLLNGHGEGVAYDGVGEQVPKHDVVRSNSDGGLRQRQRQGIEAW